MQYDVRANLKDALKMLDGLQKDQIPFATAYALTQTAKDAESNVRREMRRVFNNPTPYTLAGLFVKPATKTRLTSTVKFKDESVKGVPADRYMTVQVVGGPRRTKGFEELLIRAGVMPPNHYAVPTRAAPLDGAGNVPRGILNSMLSQLQASRDVLARETKASRARKEKGERGVQTRRARKTASPIERSRQQRRKVGKPASAAAAVKAIAKPKGKRRPSRYFTVYPGRERTKHLKPGLYERVGFGFGTAIRPVFLYVERAPIYKQRLPFYTIVDQTLERELVPNFESAFALAERTMRPAA